MADGCGLVGEAQGLALAGGLAVLALQGERAEQEAAVLDGGGAEGADALGAFAGEVAVEARAAAVGLAAEEMEAPVREQDGAVEREHGQERGGEQEADVVDEAVVLDAGDERVGMELRLVAGGATGTGGHGGREEWERSGR